MADWGGADACGQSCLGQVGEVASGDYFSKFGPPPGGELKWAFVKYRPGSIGRKPGGEQGRW